ncbi:MAG TPA: hypothetical protein VIM19_16875 [Actinomycetes bacterium]
MASEPADPGEQPSRVRTESPGRGRARVGVPARAVVSMVVIGLFVGRAMDPGVTFFNRRWG